MFPSKNLNSVPNLWHSCFGHPAVNVLKQMLTSCNALYSCPKNNDVCCACQYAKSHRLPFSLCDFKATCPLALIHTNLWGPTLVVSTIGIRYFLLFVDDFSQFS